VSFCGVLLVLPLFALVLVFFPPLFFFFLFLFGLLVPTASPSPSAPAGLAAALFLFFLFFFLFLLPLPFPLPLFGFGADDDEAPPLGFPLGIEALRMGDLDFPFFPFLLLVPPVAVAVAVFFLGSPEAGLLAPLLPPIPSSPLRAAVASLTCLSSVILKWLLLSCSFGSRRIG